MRIPITSAAILALMLAANAFGQQPDASFPTGSGSACAPSEASTCGDVWSDPCAPACGLPGRFWADFDALGWWVKGSRLPPLVTASPPGTAQTRAGVLDAPGTSILFGDATANNGLRLGGRVNLGFWLDPEQTFGIQVGFFGLEGLGNTFYANSPGSPIIARPFTDVTTNRPSSELVAFPGVVAGSVTANPTSGSFLGGDALFRQNICCGCSYRLDALAGYRFLHFGDGVAVTENLINTNPASPVALGTNIVVADSFRTSNDFNGLQLGLAGQTWRGRWLLEGLAKLAVGRTSETLLINGTTTVTAPGAAPVVNSGGLLALASNIGTYHNHPWSLVPEFGGRIGYQLNRNVYCFAGYSFIYWTHVLRAGNQIDPNVNPNLIPPITSAPNGPLRPAPLLHDNSIWAQGVSLGVQFRF